MFDVIFFWEVLDCKHKGLENNLPFALRRESFTFVDNSQDNLE